MKNLFHLLQIDLDLREYKPALLCFISAFIVTLLIIPPIISIVKKLGLFDHPGDHKIHSTPIPTLGGIAIIAGMMSALFMWFPFSSDGIQFSFFFSVGALLVVGILDDLRGLTARHKFVVQCGLAAVIALTGTRIISFEGLFGINELPLFAQYSITMLAIVGITNAFNLIDGIDGLAGGLGFMSLAVLGTYLSITGDMSYALIAFALAGGILAFLFFNFNPARIFMGDTGSLVLGFVIAVLCIRLLQVNLFAAKPVLQHAPVFVLGIVLIPVFDTMRVFAVRIWSGHSPFMADKNHIHHLLTRTGVSHNFTAKLLCFFHATILVEVFWLRGMQQEFILLIQIFSMIIMMFVLKNLKFIFRKIKSIEIPVQRLENLGY
ncbi:MAG TPA: MraY family glycosyltransferase [Chitinophagaceae bacterium]|nr:MraY family glycosyltransferase [Chitinophagaceae bacterium]